MTARPRPPREKDLPAGVECDLVPTSGDRPIEPPGWGREVDRIAALIDLGPRHPVLVGPSEVGKTARVQALAKRMSLGARPAGAQAIWQVSLRTLDGMFGKGVGVAMRLAEILREAASRHPAPIVFVRDLRMLRVYDADHAWIESLQHVRVPVIGEAGPAFAGFCADDAELASVTHLVAVDEPDFAHVIDLVRNVAAAWGSVRGLSVDPEVPELVAHLAQRLLPHRRFPGKALALLDEAMREASSRAQARVSRGVVIDRVCETLRVPRMLVDPDLPLPAEALRAALEARAVGLHDALDAVVERVALHKAGLTRPSGPLGVLLFVGPPGVGKTFASQLAARVVFGTARRLIRVSMGEFAEDWKVDQLFGQRGAQSFEGRQGSLARQLVGKPYAVLLLDEIDKAHPLALKHLARPLDEGVYLNGNDEEVSLRNVLVVMTTTLGAEVLRDGEMGFARGDGGRTTVEGVRRRLADALPAALLDRVDRTCAWGALRGEEVHTLVRREIDDAAERSGVSLVCDDEVARSIERHLGGAAGGRAIRRAVEQQVLVPVALHLAQRREGGDAPVHLTVEPDNVLRVATPPSIPSSKKPRVASARRDPSG